MHKIFIAKMHSIGSRLLYLIESQGDNLTSFSKKTEINYASLSELTRDKRNLGGVLLKRLAEAIPDLNLNWLFLGEGEMFLHKNAIESEYKNVVESSILNEPFEQYLTIDPGEEMLLKYLDSKRVQDKLKLIFKL
jgi:transcriptional regulator with XRE-family HTH domain